MKTIIAGSRHYNDYKAFCERLSSYDRPITKIISGGARGVDAMGEMYAWEQGIPLAVYSALWQNYGRAAGPIRNRQMAENADALIAFLAEKSRGTADMIKVATKMGLVVTVYKI